MRFIIPSSDVRVDWNPSIHERGAAIEPMEGEITIRPLVSPADIERTIELHRLVWPGSETSLIPFRTYQEIGGNGGILLGAFDGSSLVGYVFGFLGIDEESRGSEAWTRVKHVSHILGIHPAYRGRGVGFQLKLAQRRAVISQGIRLITWTFDPLLSNNAHLNFHRLRTVCRTYWRDYYGSMHDDVNRGLVSDRLEVEWWVTSPSVAACVEGTAPLPQPVVPSDLLARVVNPALCGSDGPLRSVECFPSSDLDTLWVEIPLGYQAIRQQDPELALAWRHHVRGILEGAFELGYWIVDHVLHRAGGAPRSFYVMSNEAPSIG